MSPGERKTRDLQVFFCAEILCNHHQDREKEKKPHTKKTTKTMTGRKNFIPLLSFFLFSKFFVMPTADAASSTQCLVVGWLVTPFLSNIGFRLSFLPLSVSKIVCIKQPTQTPLFRFVLSVCSLNFAAVLKAISKKNQAAVPHSVYLLVFQPLNSTPFPNITQEKRKKRKKEGEGLDDEEKTAVIPSSLSLKEGSISFHFQQDQGFSVLNGPQESIKKRRTIGIVTGGEGRERKMLTFFYYQ